MSGHTRAKDFNRTVFFSDLTQFQLDLAFDQAQWAGTMLRTAKRYRCWRAQGEGERDLRVQLSSSEVLIGIVYVCVCSKG